MNLIKLKCLFDSSWTMVEMTLPILIKKSHFNVWLAVVLCPFSSCFPLEFQEYFNQLHV